MTLFLFAYVSFIYTSLKSSKKNNTKKTRKAFLNLEIMKISRLLREKNTFIKQNQPIQVV